ncbi:DUF2935 domain-containing protein [Ornithinibacillus sp. FSL M8-0202]|uniref:DUF2935 domain-containing protein n=1 Tax=Ornithinibacillus sp. FSL M8-0202 TaxID=2921616 RepID=UPI0030D17DD3
MKDYIESASYEHQFWLRVLRDHATFIHESLYPEEEENIEKAEAFKHTFDTLLQKADDLSDHNVIAFTKEAETGAERLREFKLSILRRELSGDIGVHLTPTRLNHMVNELDEYVLVISNLKEGKAAPVFHELHHHLIWLPVASGHAGLIQAELDGVEKGLKGKSQQFAMQFDQFYVKAIELTGYLRTNLTTFPALMKFHEDVEVEMNLFRNFLQELKEMVRSDMVLRTFSMLTADHMDREVGYFLNKLAQSRKMSGRDNDPTP